MSDKELLELAAKAVGMHVKAQRVDADDKFTHLVVGQKFTQEKIDWNPLTDDGDALRLATILGNEFDTYTDTWSAKEAAEELRRLHEVNADLLNAAKLFIKYDSYQHDCSGMLIAYNDAIEATKAAVKKSTKDTK